MWVLWIVLLVLFVVGVLLQCYPKQRYRRHGESGQAMVGIAILVWVCTMVPWPVTYYCALADIEGYRALQQTVDASRQAGVSEFERITLTTRIIEANEAIAKAQYWNETFIFDLYWPDEIMAVELIK